MRAMLSIRGLFLSLLLAGVTIIPNLALAGGIGVFNGTGFHFGEALTERSGQGSWLNEGGGVEIALGDKALRFSGRLRFAYNAVLNLEGGMRSAGVLSVGVQIGLLPDVERPFGLYLAVDMGVSPIVRDMRVYFFGDVGPGIRVRIKDRAVLFAELTALLRYEGSFSAGPMVFLGVRFPFE